ncbi:hypothetical protein [Mycobacterium sp. E1747]|uniref:hypothetical protein n=1 Tax=Mycobacterium sp. E1747 TaxID=1834128 RepID=UPI000B002C7F|nr:hypothetical protein [Mycobacterium sp. E1747]
MAKRDDPLRAGGDQRVAELGLPTGRIDTDGLRSRARQAHSLGRFVAGPTLLF